MARSDDNHKLSQELIAIFVDCKSVRMAQLLVLTHLSLYEVHKKRPATPRPSRAKKG